jgi:C-terminal processing protease CtpA/Prc
VNALSYSATDFFAAGFQDHGIGPVLGVHGSTGGGGANVRTLQSLAGEIGRRRKAFAGSWKPAQLPAGADFHVAFRRSIRTGRSAGLEIEDFGVTPDPPIYRMSRRDALEGNPDLFEAAIRRLQGTGNS